jgi:transposase
MLFVGIDIAMDHHDIVFIDDYGEVIKEHFTILNDCVGYKKLHTEIISCMKPFGNVHIGMEETGIYHENLRDFLIDLDFKVYTINPLLTSFSRKAASPRRTKTDKIDALAIAKYVLQNVRSLHPYTPSLYHQEELRGIMRLYYGKQFLVSKSKTEIKRLLQIIFPEFLKNFDPFAKGSLEILLSYPTPKDFTGVRSSTLAKKLLTHSNRDTDAKLIKELASNTVGKSNQVNTFLIRSEIKSLIHYQNLLDELKVLIKEKMDGYPRIMTIPGVGPITGAIILGETGDIHRFENKHQYFAFYGLDPIIYESGKFKLKKSKISKRGNVFLRSAIYNAARAACVAPNVRDNKFRRKYLSMMAKGNKHHSTVVFAIAKNMVHSIYAMLKHGTDYDDKK